MCSMSMKVVSVMAFVFMILSLTTCLGGLSFGLLSASQSSGLLVAVIVDSEVYSGIETSLQRYKEDVERYGFSVNITETDKLRNQTKEGVKWYLQGFWEPAEQTIGGALLIGDIAEARYEAGSYEFPTDMYYMDLNGVWTDTDGNGVYDKHVDVSGPEIWVGRLKASSGADDEVALLNTYFERNHLYRNGLSSIPWWRALLYMDDLGVAQGHDALTSLRYIAPQVLTVTDGATTNAEDYKQRLQDEVGYQWLYLMSHGNTTNHTFQIPSVENYYEWDGTVYSSDYEALNPRVSFYQLFICSAGRYTEEDYLAGAMVLGNDYGLLAVASTDVTYTYPYDGFYKAMSKGNIIGNAFLQWLRNATTDYAQRASVTNSSISGTLDLNQYNVLVHDTVLIGDPTIRLQIENHDIQIVSVTALLQNVSDTETVIVSLVVQNSGGFQETFNLSVHIDLDLVYQKQMTIEPGSNETITFSPSNASKYIWSDFIHHRVRAEISLLPEEFDVEDNVRDEYFVSRQFYRSTLGRIPDVLFALGGILTFGIICYGFMKLLMADRPLHQLQELLARVNVRIKTALVQKD